jgi:non-ribosomal peptide synthetase component F
VAALAVWKSGGAYVPLDPAWSGDLREWLITDSQATVLITRGFASRARFLIDLDRDAPAIARENSAFYVPPIKRDRLACIVYEPGDLRPAGVELTHGNLLNLIFWHRREFGVTWGDRAAHLASFSTPAALLELWPFLTAGANVVSGTQPASPTAWMVEQNITMAYVPAQDAEAVLGAEWSAETALRFLLAGSGPRTSTKLPFRVARCLGSIECGMVAACGKISDAAIAPVENVQFHVLDANFQAVKTGETGDVYVGGAGLARGYRNRRDLNQERFIPNPFVPAEDARLYRTGARGFLLPDGKIGFADRA